MCVCIVKLNNLCVFLFVNTVPLVLRSIIFFIGIFIYVSDIECMQNFKIPQHFFEFSSLPICHSAGGGVSAFIVQGVGVVPNVFLKLES